MYIVNHISTNGSLEKLTVIYLVHTIFFSFTFTEINTRQKKEMLSQFTRPKTIIVESTQLQSHINSSFSQKWHILYIYLFPNSNFYINHAYTSLPFKSAVYLFLCLLQQPYLPLFLPLFATAQQPYTVD